MKSSYSNSLAVGELFEGFLQDNAMLLEHDLAALSVRTLGSALSTLKLRLGSSEQLCPSLGSSSVLGQLHPHGQAPPDKCPRSTLHGSKWHKRNV